MRRCRSCACPYWRPLYSYIRRRGHAKADAQDLTQKFFARLLEKNYLAAANLVRSRFRSYLLGAMKHFLADAHDRRNAQKRGGGITFIPIEFDTVEGRCNLEPVDETTAEKLFDKQWALEILDRTMSALKEEFITAEKAEQFKHLRTVLVPDAENLSYKDLAAKMGTTEGNVKVAVHRLRRRYKEVLRNEISQTLSNPGDGEDELRHLFGVGGTPTLGFVT